MIAIVDYGLGNLASVQNMFRKIGVMDTVITSDAHQIAVADKILLPGVGSFDAGMSKLEASGLIPLLNKKALEEKVPVLGICLGMQMLSRKSEEGVKKGLGWIDGETVKFNLDPSLKLKVPHMGWDYINVIRKNPLLEIGKKQRFYFVHSYYVICDDVSQVLATCDFDGPFVCAVNKGNIFGTQFHPEKSLAFGMDVLSNFNRI